MFIMLIIPYQTQITSKYSLLITLQDAKSFLGVTNPAHVFNGDTPGVCRATIVSEASSCVSTYQRPSPLPSRKRLDMCNNVHLKGFLLLKRESRGEKDVWIRRKLLSLAISSKGDDVGTRAREELNIDVKIHLQFKSSSSLKPTCLLSNFFKKQRKKIFLNQSLLNSTCFKLQRADFNISTIIFNI